MIDSCSKKRGGRGGHAFALFFVFLACCQVAAEKLTCAIITMADGLTVDEKRFLTDRFTSHIFDTDYYTLLERGDIENVLREQVLQQTGCTTDACAVKIGEMLNARHVVLFTVGKLHVKYSLSARTIDVEVGKIVGSASTICDGNAATLDAALRFLSERLLLSQSKNLKNKSVTPRNTNGTYGDLYLMRDTLRIFFYEGPAVGGGRVENLTFDEALELQKKEDAMMEKWER